MRIQKAGGTVRYGTCTLLCKLDYLHLHTCRDGYLFGLDIFP